MLVGIIGAPNKGKSTIFSALTMVDAEVADYPFTTIKPNFGVGYITKECVEKELGVKCKPRNSLCANGTRQIPVNITDVAGLVPDAHLGKGMGNQFLNDLISADALIQVVDLSGKTDMQGNPSEKCDPAEEVAAVRKEIALWLAGIIAKHIGPISKRSDGDKALREVLAGFNMNAGQIKRAAEESRLGTSRISWSGDDTYRFADALLKISKPVIVAANKLDASEDGALERLKKMLPDHTVIGCSGAVELALRKAAKNGVIEYVPGSGEFKTMKETSGGQRRALDFMAGFMKRNGGTGVQNMINAVFFDVLQNIVVYPVEDENRYADHFGNVLPDALLVPKGSKAVDMAGRIHTELAENMLYAVDAKKKLKVAKDYVLKDNDVIRIVSEAK